MEKLIAKLALKSDALANAGGSIRLDLPEGSIFISSAGRITEHYQTADCSFRTTSPVLHSLLEGSIDPMSSIITGKVHFAGNVNVALNLKNSLFGQL